MKDQLDRLENKVDKTVEDISNINQSVARMEVHLSENKEDWKVHMKRTDYNEDRIIRLEKIEQWIRGATWITLALGGLVLAVIRLFK